MEAMRTAASTGPCSATTPPVVTTAAAATPAPQPSSCARASTGPVLLRAPSAASALVHRDRRRLAAGVHPVEQQEPASVLGPAFGSLTTVVSALVTRAGTANVLPAAKR